MFQHNNESLKYISDKKNEDSYWSSAFLKAKLYPKIKFLDEARIFLITKIRKSYIMRIIMPKANRLIADYIQLNI